MLSFSDLAPLKPTTRQGTMKSITHQRKTSQRFTKFFVGGLLFPVPRLFWMGIERTFLPRPLLCNHFMQKALVAAANRCGEPLCLIDNQEEKNFSPLGFTQKSASLRIQPHQSKYYLKQALLELRLNQATELPPLSLITTQKSLIDKTAALQKIWEKELGIECSLVPFPPKKGDQTLHLAFAEWNTSSRDPLFQLDAFKKETDKLKPSKNFWQHPGYQSLFEKTKKETNPKKRKDQLSSLEEMVIQDLSILPLFYRSYCFLTREPEGLSSMMKP